MTKAIRIRRVPGGEAPAEWSKLHAEFARTGRYPVLLGDREECGTVKDTYDENRLDFGSTEDIVARSRLQTPADWYRERKAALELSPDWPTAPDAPWPPQPDEGACGEIHAHLDMTTGLPKREVCVASLEVLASWETFARLAWGGFNECPLPHVHCILHRDWEERFGSEIVSLTDSVVECRVARPPSTREEAYLLAQEHYLYCPDIVDQGTESIVGLAAELLGNPYWFFWWD